MDPEIERSVADNVDKSVLVYLHPDSGDPFTTSKVRERTNSFYASKHFGFPTAIVDGLVNKSGGSINYNFISNEIANRIATKTLITIYLPTMVHSNSIDFSAHIKSEMVINSDNLRLFVYVTESDISFSGRSYDHVVRDILPDTDGYTINLKDQQALKVVINGTVNLNSSWNKNKIDIIAFVQDISTQEIYQTELVLNTFLDVTDNQNTSIPAKFELYDLYPNPFNPAVNIPFTINDESAITIKVIDLIGKEIETLVNNQKFNPGSHKINWNAGNRPAGIYFIKVKTNQGTKFKKALLLK